MAEMTPEQFTEIREMLALLPRVGPTQLTRLQSALGLPETATFEECVAERAVSANTGSMSATQGHTAYSERNWNLSGLSSMRIW